MHKSAENISYQPLIRKFIIAGISGITIYLIGLFNIIPPLTHPSGQLSWLIIGIISLIVIIYSGGQLYSNAWQALLHKSSSMDTLIALGTGSAWLYSQVITIFPTIVPSLAQHIYFETALIIIALVNLGSALESKARGKTSQAIQRLLDLQPKTARVIKNNQAIDVLIEELQLGDSIKVKPGEKIAVDGEIIQGNSLIDQSMITGEAIPVTKTIGDQLIGGTINKTSSVIFKATRIAKDTTLAQIINLVRQAQQTKPPIARLADVVSAIFVPAVIIIAVITALLWLAFGPIPKISFTLVTSMTVLIIACPCALGLATPISVMVGMGKAAEYGSLIRNGQALQQASQLTTIVLDKTGTITQGHPEVMQIYSFNHWQENHLLQLAASIENNSEHPLGQAIVDQATFRQLALLPVENFTAIAGLGASATINQKLILLGNAKLMSKHQISIDHLTKQISSITKFGHTIIYLAVDKQIAGIITIADPIKTDSTAAINRLKQLGLQVIMLTGDNQATAEIVAKQVNIDQQISDVLPQDKANQIKRLQNQQQIVGMVGDGINDAPALAQANVGFAIGSGTDVAIESADITLISNSIHGVADAIAISTATMRNIKQNLFGAFIYNGLGIPIAAGILYPLIGLLLNPIIAGAAMTLSSLTVVSNANRLRWLKIHR